MPMPARSLIIRDRQPGPRRADQWYLAERRELFIADCFSIIRNVIRTSVGVGLIWASPFGPLRFDYAVPLTKGQFDRVQQFKFGGGTSF